VPKLGENYFSVRGYNFTIYFMLCGTVYFMIWLIHEITTHSDALGTVDSGKVVRDSDSVGDAESRIADWDTW
jgi:hypothetical protein